MMWGNLGHALPPFISFIAAIVLVSVIRGNGMLDRLDRVAFYTYTKAAVDRDAALVSHPTTTTEWAWLGDGADTAHCLDMRGHNYPVVGFIPGSDPTGPSCNIVFTTADSPGPPPVLTIVPSYTQSSVSGCKPGIYPLEISGGGGAPSSATNLYIAVQSATVNAGAGLPPKAVTQVVVTVPTAVSLVNTSYTTAHRAQWQACRDRRLALAKQYLDATSCQGESSQLCSCVRAFTGKLTNFAHPLSSVLPGDVKLQDALLGGVDRCIRLRRAHDVRAAAPGTYFRSSALLMFTLALFLNSILYLARFFSMPPMGRALTHLGWFALLFVLLNGGGTEAILPLCVLLPALLILLGYDLYVELSVAPELPSPAAYLHPVAFDILLCQLSLFTLVERGVVQREYLIVEVFKCHAIAAIYSLNVWYHRYRYWGEAGPGAAGASGAEGLGLTAAGVEHARHLLVATALAAAGDSLLLPYPSKSPFQLHWLLPLALTYIALANPTWAYDLLARYKRAPAEPEVAVHAGLNSTYFNNRAARLIFGVWLVLLGYFLVDHVRVHGAGHFPYPAYLGQGDGGLPLVARDH